MAAAVVESVAVLVLSEVGRFVQKGERSTEERLHIWLGWFYPVIWSREHNSFVKGGVFRWSDGFH